MTDEASIDSIEALAARLNKVREQRQKADLAPTLEYCLICDESNLVVRTGGSLDYRHLDCEHTYTRHVITEGYEHAGISEWIKCIEYIKSRFLDTGSDTR